MTIDATLLIRLSLPLMIAIGSSTQTFIRPSSRAQRCIWGPEISDCISLDGKAISQEGIITSFQLGIKVLPLCAPQRNEPECIDDANDEHLNLLRLFLVI